MLLAPSWEIWLATFVGLLSGISLLAWAMGRGRAPMRRHCPRCQQDMTGVPSLTCPECGFTVKREAQLMKRPSHRLAAYSGLLLASAAVIVFLQVIAPRGPLTGLPGPVLRWVMPWLPDSGSSKICLEFRKRLANGEVDPQAALALAQTCLDQRAADSDPAKWPQRYRLVLDDIVQASSSWGLRYGDAQAVPLIARLDGILDGLGIEIEVSHPNQWSADEPIMLGLKLRDWSRRGRRILLTILPEGTSDPCQDRALRAAVAWPGTPLHWDIGRLAAGQHQVKVNIDWQWREDGPTAQWQDGGRLVHEFPLTVSPPVSLIGGETGVLQERMADAMRDGMLWWNTGAPRAAFRIDTRVVDEVHRGNLLMGVQIEARENGVARRTLRAWWGGPSHSYGDLNWELAHEDLPALARAAKSAEGWTLHVSGHADLARRGLHQGSWPLTQSGRSSRALPLDAALQASPMDADGNPVVYWSGCFEVPLLVSPMDDTASVRAWTRVPHESGSIAP